jgi:Ca-activated chloride channel homolog
MTAKGLAFMTRSAGFPFLLPLLAALVGLTIHAQTKKPNHPPATQTEDDVVRINTTLVTVPVSIRDRKGHAVLSLNRQDFRLFEDGVEQEIVYFEAPADTNNPRSESAGKPLTVALLLDLSDSTQFKLQQIQNAALTFIDHLGGDDRMLVIAFDKRVQVLAEATSDRTVLRQAISQTRSGGGTSLYDALDAVISSQLNQISGRKTIVLLTDGVDTTSTVGTYAGTVRAAEQLDAPIYPVQYNTYGDFVDNPSRETYGNGNLNQTAHMTKGGELASEAYKRATLYLRLLAEKTGGRFEYTDSVKNLSRSFARIASELKQEYTLGYYPKNQNVDGTKRELKVQVSAPRAVVRARKSYIFRKTK